MRITIPDSYDEVTVHQYQQLWKAFEQESDDATSMRRCIEIMAGLDNGALNHAEWHSLQEASHKVLWFLNDPNPFKSTKPVQQRVRLDGREYGFIPDWTKLSVAEYVDLQTLCDKGMVEHLDKVMAILYRPIVKDALGMYDIESYEPDNHRTEVMRGCAMSVCVSAVVFFCGIAKELATNMPASLIPETESKETP